MQTGFTIQQAARLVGVSVGTLKRWEKGGKIGKAARLARPPHARVYTTELLTEIKQYKEKLREDT